MLLANPSEKPPLPQDVLDFTEDQAREFFEERRWPDGPRCVHCRSRRVSRLQGESTRQGLFCCRACRKTFTVRVGTVLEDSHISLEIWARAFHLLAASKRGMTVRELHRRLGSVSYRTAWLLSRRLRQMLRCRLLADALTAGNEPDGESVPPTASQRHHLVERLGAARADLSPYRIRDAPDYAEVLIAEVLGGTRVASRITQGHDVIAPGYGRVEVKCRQLPTDGRSEERVQIQPTKEGGFDFLAMVIFLPDFAVKGAVLLPYCPVWELAASHKFNRISYSRARKLPGACDLTEAVRCATAF